MNSQLHITIGTEPTWTVTATITNQQPAPEYGIPEIVAGKLLNLSTDNLLKIKFGTDVKVGFDTRRYIFTRLEKDGVFELGKDW